MYADGLGLPLSVAHLRPPYTGLEPLPGIRALRALKPTPASLLAVQVADPSAAWPSLREWVPRLRASFPAVPVVLRFAGTPAAESVHLAFFAAHLRVRAVLVEDEPVAETLRCRLTRPAALGTDVEEWLELRGLRVNAEMSRLVRRIVDRAPRFTEVTGLLRSLGESDSTVRAWFHARALPPPGQWLAAARALHAALRLQAEPRTSMLTVAVEAGYSDHSTLSRQVQNLFGVRPGRIRGTLGWEWLLERWLARGNCEMAPSPPL
jgi:AraC-like DNA-binding protein